MRERPTITVDAGVGGWPDPWPNVAEIESVLPHQLWTLIGGLMVQLHAIHKGVGGVRPTSDVDMIVHIETGQQRPAVVADALEQIGYALSPAMDPRSDRAHRFKRGRSTIGMVATGPRASNDVVDVVVADHAAPSLGRRMRGKGMVEVQGGTQALKRTVNARLDIVPGHTTTLSVPSAFGALVLKAAAYQSDSRDRERHLADAVVLLACIEDPIQEREGFAGSDRRRLHHIQGALDSDHRSWARLPSEHRRNARAALGLLCRA